MKKILFPLLLLTACGGGGSSDDQGTITTPANPAQGTVLEESCDGTTLIQTIADGNGGSTQEETPDSTKCGYVAPPVFGTPLGDAYCANASETRFQELLNSVQNLGQYDKVRDFADGEGGSYTEVVDTDSEECGWTAVPEEGTPIGESYCAVELEEDLEYLDIVSERINHLLREDRLQDYADGEGGIYTDRLEHLDQTCFEQMTQPEDCPTTPTDTGDSRYGYLTCDGVKQKSGVSFPYDPDQYETAVIDMLIVFDTNITEEDRDGMTVEEFVNKQIYESNHMYISSGTKTLVRLAGIKLVEVAPGDLYRQYSAFFGGRYEFNGLDDWQREVGADIAFLFKKRPENPIACGVASLDATQGLSKTRGIAQCFHNSVFQENASTRYYERAHETFAHEIGHLLGAQHEWEDADRPGIFEYSFAYNLPGYNPNKDNPEYDGIHGGYGTIMSYADLATGRFSNYDLTCTYPDEAGEYAGQSVKMGTTGGCFCVLPPEEQPPPTNNVETIARTRYIMSQLHELEHGLQFSPVTMYMDGLTFEEDPEICLF
jgi:hypothetical protein